MITLNFFEIPEQGDRGNVFCPAIERNFTELDAHNHNGSNSEQISSKSVVKSTTSLLIANWVVNVAGQTWKQSVTLPAGYTMSSVEIVCKVGSGAKDGDRCYPTIHKTSASAFDVIVNDNTVDLDIVYL